MSQAGDMLRMRNGKLYFYFIQKYQKMLDDWRVVCYTDYND